MRVLVLNAGSSSVKFELFDMTGPATLVEGTVERIGDSASGVPDHVAAFARIAGELADGGITDADLDAIGHRVVHGGDRFHAPAIIDDDVVMEIRTLVPLAPLHNPANLEGVAAARAQFPTTPHVAVFDTAFHATMPAPARRYAIPEHTEREHGIRRYGFHGSSYQYITRRAAALLGKSVAETNLIALHLGNGASACAIENGSSVETSMGFTPLEGLVMGTRSGDIDAAAVLHLQRHAGLSVDEVDTLLNRESGLRGLCGDSDMRAVCKRAADGDARADEAIALYCHRIRKYIGAFYAVLPRVDALVFAAGIGEHRPEIRRRICEGLAHLGIVTDAEKNAAAVGEDGFIDAPEARVRLLVVRTDEAMEIATQAAALVRGCAD